MISFRAGWKLEIKQGLSWLFPSALFLPGLPEGPLPLLKLEKFALDPETEIKAHALGSCIRLSLAPSLALERRIHLPDEAIDHAKAAIDLEMQQSFPSRAQGLVWGYALSAKSRGKSEFIIQIVKAAPLLHLIGELGQKGTHVSSVCIGGPKGPTVWNATKNKNIKPRPWILLGVLLSVALTFVNKSILGAQATDIEALLKVREQKIVALQTRLTSAKEQGVDSSARGTALEDAATIFQLERQRLGLLQDISTRLPDGVWVSELTVSGGNLTISGFSSIDVSRLIIDLQSAPWAERVSLEGAITQDVYSNQSRFSVAVELKPVEPNQ